MTELKTAALSPVRRAAGRDAIRGRALITGALLILFNDWLAIRLLRFQFFPTAVAPFPVAVFLLLLLTLANGSAAKAFGRRFWSRAELVTVYTMVSIGAALHSEWMIGILVTVVGHAHAFATPENRWRELF